MTDTPASPGDGFEVVVGDDGALTVSAAELVAHGVGPGARLRLVLAQGTPAPKHARMAGSLAGSVPAEVVEDLLQALDEVKAERVARFGQTVEQP